MSHRGQGDGNGGGDAPLWLRVLLYGFFLIWAVSMIESFFNSKYQPPPEVHAIMLAVVGLLTIIVRGYGKGGDKNE